MEDLDIGLKEKEVLWIRVYFASRWNATEATRVVYGGTPLSCRVKGHKRLVKLAPIICDIAERGFDKMANGVDLYLSDLERKVREREAFIERMGLSRGSKRSQRVNSSAKEEERANIILNGQSDGGDTAQLGER